jgi:hypothetical protein
MENQITVPVTLIDVQGQPVKLYVEARDLGGEQEVGFSFAEGFDGVMDTIKSVSMKVSDALQAVSPDKFSVELGFEFVLEAGKLVALFAKAGGTASINVTLEWTKSPPKPVVSAPASAT